MKLHLAGIVALIGIGPLFGQLPPRFDFTKSESPPKPLPEWIKADKGKQLFIDQGQFDPRLKGYLTPEGVRVEIVADFPSIVNPVGMTFGEDGTLYVLEWLPGGSNWNEVAETFTYKDGSKRQVATMRKSVKDVVKTLRFNKGKGVFDNPKVILEEELPSSILLHDGWLYLSGRGTVRRYKQSKPGGPYDVKEVIAQGFCGYHHHQVSGMTIGNDGWLYITSGDDDNYVEGSDGSRATVLRTGAVFRCRPDGSKMQVWSIGYRNPYRDVVFDAGFNMFHVDNDNEDGSKFQGCRLMHVAEESDFGWRLLQGARCCQPDKVRGAVWGELPGKVPPMLKTGRGAPAGLLLYEEDRFPENYRGLLYYPDVFRKLVRAYEVGPVGASFTVKTEFELLKSDDPLFRPCQMVAGPDGAMYVCDWRTDSGGAGQLAGNGKAGRIYRIRWAGAGDEPAIELRGLDSWAGITNNTIGQLQDLMESDCMSDRLRAQLELARRGGDKVRALLLKDLGDPDMPVLRRVAAMGALNQLWNDEVRKGFMNLVQSAGSQHIRRLAAEGLALNCKPGDEEAHAALLRALGDQNLAARRAIALAMGRIGTPDAADALASAVKFDRENDAYLADGYLRAIERLGKPGIDKLIELAQSGDAKDFDKVVDAFLALRTRPAAEAIPTLLAYPHVTVPQKRALLRSYTNYLLDPPVALEPVAKYLLANPKEMAEVQLAGLETLAAGGALKGEKIEDLAIRLLDETDPGIRDGVVRMIEVGRVGRAAPKLAGLLADKDRPVAERTAMVKALRALGDKSIAAVLKEIVAPAKEREPAALRLEALRSLVALDPAAARQAAPPLLDEKDPLLQAEAILVLGGQPDGAKVVAERFLAGKLPRELLPQVSESLRKHAKQPELAKLLTEVMKGGLLVSLDKAEVERIEKLVQAKGSPERGKALYLASKQLACINCHRLEGVGGSVGPDLTRLWDTMSVEKIMESMIDPSKEIKEGFQAYTAATKGGQVHTGLLISKNADEVVIREASGKDIRIPMKEIEALAPSKQSLMPDNVISQLTFDQFIDLVAFLKNRPAQESLRGMALEFWVVGPFAGAGPHPPESKPDPAAKYGNLAWQPLQAEVNGLLNLKAVFSKEKTTGYALTYVYSPKPQKVQMLAGSSDLLKVWVNDQAVHEHAKPRQARPDDDKVDIDLKAGWNSVLARVSGSESEQGLFLRFAGTDLKISLKPEGK